MGLNSDIIQDNLKKFLDKPIDTTTFNRLCKLVNYDEITKFSNCSALIAAIKISNTSTSSVYCVSTLNNIRKLIEYYMNPEAGSLPIVDSRSNSIKLNDFLTQFTENINLTNTNGMVSKLDALPKLKENRISKPLKWGDKSITDYISLDLDTFIICREIVKSKE